MALLDIDGLCSGYGNSTILHGLNLAVPEGKITAIFGPNGGGKTTLTHTLMRRLPIQRGRVTYSGRSLNERSTEALVRDGMAVVPQEANVFRNLTIGENLRVAATEAAGNQLTRRLDEAFGLFPALRPRHGQLAGTLSGGERQMLAIASAIVARPRLLILDEPTSGLAPIIVKALIEVAIGYARGGATVLWMVGDCADDVLGRVDHAHLMQSGAITGSWTPESLPKGQSLADLYFGGIDASHTGRTQ